MKITKEELTALDSRAYLSLEELTRVVPELIRLAHLGLWAEEHGIKSLRTANEFITEEWPEEHWKHNTCTAALKALPKEMK